MILEISTEIMSPRLQFEEVMRILLSTYKIKAPDICKIMIVTSVCITPLEVTHFINSVTIVSDKNDTLAATTKTKGSPSFAAECYGICCSVAEVSNFVDGFTVVI